jgi:hypothetical protein
MLQHQTGLQRQRPAISHSLLHKVQEQRFLGRLAYSGTLIDSMTTYPDYAQLVD